MASSTCGCRSGSISGRQITAGMDGSCALPPVERWGSSSHAATSLESRVVAQNSESSNEAACQRETPGWEFWGSLTRGQRHSRWPVARRAASNATDRNTIPSWHQGT